MADTIATRVARIIAGGTHALLDKAEDLAPDAVMTQSIREIEQVIAEAASFLGAARGIVLGIEIQYQPGACVIRQLMDFSVLVHKAESGRCLPGLWYFRAMSAA